MLANGKGGSETPLDRTDPGVSHTPVAMGDDLANSEDGTNLSGSNDGRRGYSRESPTTLNAVWRVSRSVNKIRQILLCGGF